MKVFLSLIFLAAGFSSQLFAQDYSKIAKELCGCVNSEAKGISAATRNAIIQSATDGTDLELLFTELAEKDADQLMKDAELLQKIGEDIGNCTEKMEKKFPELSASSDDAEDATNKLVEALGKTKGCEFTWALMILGQQAEEDDYYYDE